MTETKLSPPRIVCAAIRYDIHIIVAPRHFDSLMHSQISRLDVKIPSSKWEQGFVDQHCRFYTREEAWVIAEQNGQITRQVSSPGVLYSENLY